LFYTESIIFYSNWFSVKNLFRRKWTNSLIWSSCGTPRRSLCQHHIPLLQNIIEKTCSYNFSPDNSSGLFMSLIGCTWFLLYFYLAAHIANWNKPFYTVSWKICKEYHLNNYFLYVHDGFTESRSTLIEKKLFIIITHVFTTYTILFFLLLVLFPLERLYKCYAYIVGIVFIFCSQSIFRHLPVVSIWWRFFSSL